MEPSKENENSSATDKMLDKAANTINWWTRISRINADDAIFAVVLKVLMRIVGIIIAIILSPFVIIGLIVGFVTVL